MRKLKRLIGVLFVRLGFYHAVDVYYDCLERKNLPFKYTTITIRKHPLGGVLKIGNGMPTIIELCDSCGTLVSQGNVYGYVVFRNGYLIFGGNLREIHFGHALWKNKRGISSREISTFCTYTPYSEENLKDTINLLKHI